MNLFLHLGMCMATTVPYHILACWHKASPKSSSAAHRISSMYDNTEKVVQLLRPIAPSIVHPLLESWDEKRLVWARLDITSPLCSVQWSEKASVLGMAQAHANAIIKLMAAFEKGEHILNLWDCIHLAMSELFEALITVRYKNEELNASAHMTLMDKVLEEYEHRFNTLEQKLYGHPNANLSRYLPVLSDQRAKESKERDLLLLAQNYNLMNKLLPLKHYSHLDAFNRSCAEFLAGFPTETPYGRIIRVIFREKVKALSSKWAKRVNDNPIWSTWYGIPVPMQFTIRSICEHNSLLGRIVERHWSMFIRGLYLDMFSSDDIYDPSPNFNAEVTEIFCHSFDLRGFLGVHADFGRIEKYLDRLHSQFSRLFMHLTSRPVLKALKNFVGFKRMEDFRTTEEWVSLLRSYWPISNSEVSIQNEVMKLLQEIN